MELPEEAEVIRRGYVFDGLIRALNRYQRLLTGQAIHEQQGGKEQAFDGNGHGLTEAEARADQMKQCLDYLETIKVDVVGLNLAAVYVDTATRVPIRMVELPGYRGIITQENGQLSLKYGSDEDPQHFSLAGLGEEFKLKVLSPV